VEETRDALGFCSSLALGPLALYKAALAQWLGSSGVPSAVVPVAIPFGGLLAYWPWRAGVFEQIVWVTIPALVPLLIAVRAWRGGFRSVEAVALIVNVVLFAILLNASSYVQVEASGRVAAGIVLATVTCIPLFDRATGKNRLWLWVSVFLWLSFFPVALFGTAAFHAIHLIKITALNLLHAIDRHG